MIESLEIGLNSDRSLVLVDDGQQEHGVEAVDAVRIGLDLVECGVEAVCTEEQHEAVKTMLRESSVFEQRQRILEGDARLMAAMQREIVRDRRVLLIWSGFLIVSGIILAISWIDLAAQMRSAP